MDKFAVITTNPDGAEDVYGPYTSETRARLYADRLYEREGWSADVHLMGAPRDLAALSRGE